MLKKIKSELRKLKPIDIDEESALEDLEEFKKLPSSVQEQLRKGFIERLRTTKDKPKKEKKFRYRRKILPTPDKMKRWYA